MELTEFLRARLDEDEAAAKAADPGPWHVRSEDGDACIESEPDEWSLVANAYKGEENAAHVARHDPARVLREVEAKRAIVAAYQDQADRSLPEGVHDGRDDNERDCDEAMKCALEEAVQHLAAVWSDHADYDPAWRA